MILFEKDINEVKKLVHGIKVKAIINGDDDDIKDFADKLMYIIERYQDNYDYFELTTHHERQALSFMMRFAEHIRDLKIHDSGIFMREFFDLLDDYIALKNRMRDVIKRGDK